MLEQRHWCRSDVFIVNFEHFTPCSSVSIVNFEQVNAGLIIAERLLLESYLLILLLFNFQYLFVSLELFGSS